MTQWQTGESAPRNGKTVHVYYRSVGVAWGQCVGDVWSVVVPDNGRMLEMRDDPMFWSEAPIPKLPPGMSPLSALRSMRPDMSYGDWVPIASAVREEGRIIHGFFAGSGANYATYHRGQWMVFLPADREIVSAGEITHWLPLPEPPRLN